MIIRIHNADGSEAGKPKKERKPRSKGFILVTNLLYTLLFDRKITACGFIDIDIEKICYIDKKVGTVIEKRVKIESRNRCIYIFRSRRKLVYEPLAHRIVNVVFIKIRSEIF